MLANTNPDQTRIAFIVLRDDPNDGRLRRQVMSLETAGYKVQKFPVFTDIGTAPKTGLIQVLRRPVAFRRNRAKLWKNLTQFKPALVISHEPEALSVAGDFVRAHGLPHIYDAHEFYDAQRGADEKRIVWLKKTYQRHGSSVDQLITVSPGLIDLYAEHHPGLPKGILVANAAKVSPDLKYDGRLHDEIGEPGPRKILLYQGGIWHERGIEDVVDASTKLPPEWVTVFMGYGPAISSMPQSDRLFLVPSKPQAELMQWTAGASLGIIPYPDNSLNHRYCLPNKLWEFPLAGVPLLSRDLPNLSDVIHKWDIGMTYPVGGTGEDIANALIKMTPQQQKQMVKNCRKFAQTENWNKYEDLLLNMVSNLIKEPKL